MKLLSSVESWHSFFEWSSVVLVALTVLAGAGALITARIVNDRQTERIRNLDINVANARTKQADAERSLLELQELIKQPRTIDQQRAHEILDSGEKGLVKISYSMIGDEPMTLAKQLAETLLAHGWQIVSVEPVIPVARKTGILIQAHGDSIASFVGKDWPEAPEPAKTLHRLFVEALTGNPIVETRIGPDQPNDKLGVTIAAKY
jgi:hypothetical protein